MSDLKNIDDLIKKGIEKEYPVDGQLWSAAQNQLDAVFPVKAKKLGWVYAGATTLIVAIACLYFLNSHKSSQQTAVINDSENVKDQIATDQSSTKTHPNKSNYNSNKSTTHNSNNSNTAERKSKALPKEITKHKSSPIKQHVGSNPVHFNTGSTSADKTKFKNNPDNPTSPIGNQTNSRFELKQDAYVKPNVSEDEKIGFVLPKPLSEMLKSEQSKNTKGEVEVQYKNPVKADWFIGVSTGITFNSSDQFMVEGTEGSSINHKRTTQFDVFGGIVKRRLSVSIGFGQVVLNNQVNLALTPTTITDTISMSYRMVEENVVINGRNVSLIERQFNTVDKLDSSNRFEEVEQNVRYFRVPLRVTYRLPLNRFEVLVGLGSDLWFTPNVRWGNYSDQRYSVKQTDFAPKQFVFRPNADIGLGYRVNSRFTASAILTKSLTTSAIMTDGGNRLNLNGLNLSLNYRL